MTGLRIVTPFRPFPIESSSHQELGDFDWLAAIRMLSASVAKHCHCETVVITDVDTDLPMPSVPLVTTHRRLMLWIVEVSLAYLSSTAFDCDTIMLSPDTIVTADLRRYFDGDLTILLRTGRKYRNRPILNAAQWWPVAAKDRLIAFYRDALAQALTLNEQLLVWGADSQCLRDLLEPLKIGRHTRHGLTVSFVEASSVLRSISKTMLTPTPPLPPIVDFKGPARKPHMAGYFQALEATW